MRHRINDPKSPAEFFNLLTPTTRQRLFDHFKKFAWDYATATAMGYSASGKRIGPAMPEEMQHDISNAMLEALFGQQGAADFKIFVGDKVAE